MAKVSQTAFGTEFPKITDFSQFYADYNRMVGDFSKMFINGKAPSVDVEAIVNSQRKNFEAVAAANRIALQGMQAVAQRQAEIVRQSVEEFSELSKSLTATGTPEDKFARQATLVKEGFETALVNLREFSELLQKSGGEAFDLLSKRFGENLDEVQVAIAGKGAKKTAAQ